MPERLFTVIATADLLSVSRSTVYRLIEAHGLRTTRIAGKTRVPESEIDRLIKEGMDPMTGPTRSTE